MNDVNYINIIMKGMRNVDYGIAGVMNSFSFRKIIIILLIENEEQVIFNE